MATIDARVRSMILVPGYELLEPISHGGFSQIYLAQDQKTKEQVAIKVAADNLKGPIGLKKLTAMFENECHFLNQFRGSQYVVQFRDQGWTNEHAPYITLEYLKGGPFRSFYKGMNDQMTNGSLMVFDQDVMLSMILKTARAVAALHAAEVIHGDISPTNILLTEDNQPKLSDLGLATTFAEAKRNGSTRGRCGTPGFMAPEDTATPPGDILALGTVFYMALTGEAPRVPAVQEFIKKNPTSARVYPPRPPSTIAPARQLQSFDKILLKCVDPDASKRYPNAGALVEALEDAIQKKQSRRRRARSPSPTSP